MTRPTLTRAERRAALHLITGLAARYLRYRRLAGLLALPLALFVAGKLVSDGIGVLRVIEWSAGGWYSFGALLMGGLGR